MGRKIKVLYMIPSEKFGGAERQATLAIKALPDFDISVTPMVGPGEMIIDALRREGVTDYLHTDLFPDDVHSDRFLGRIWGFIDKYRCFRNSVKYITGLVKENDFDLIYATRTFSWFVSGFVSRKIDIPVLWRCGSRLTSDLQRFIIGRLVYFAKPRGIVVTCESMIRSFGKKPPVPTHIIWHSVDSKRFNPDVRPDPFREKYGLNSDYRYIGIAARPAPEKGPEFVVSILKYLVNKDKRIKLVWAGESSKRAIVEKMFDEQGLSAHAIFLGHIPDIENFYASIDVAMLTPREISIDTTPNSLLEPMSMGKAVVATDAGGIPEIIENGRSGFILKYGDTEGFGEKILKLISDKEMAHSVGNNARERILTEHNETVNIGKLALIIKKTVA